MRDIILIVFRRLLSGCQLGNTPDTLYTAYGPLDLNCGEYHLTAAAASAPSHRALLSLLIHLLANLPDCWSRFIFVQCQRDDVPTCFRLFRIRGWASINHNASWLVLHSYYANLSIKCYVQYSCHILCVICVYGWYIDTWRWFSTI